MADHDKQHDLDRQLEDRLAGYRDRIAYPEMGDSAAQARLRIENQSRTPATPLPVASPFDDWDDIETSGNEPGTVLDFQESRPSRMRQALALSAAVLAMIVIGGTLIALLPRITDDDEARAVLGPDTMGYEFAGTLGGSMIPNEPVDVALDSEGNIYAADVATRSILKFTPEGQFVDSFTAEGSDLGAFIRPWSVAIEGSTLYVLDQRQVAIYQFDLDGNTLDAWRIGDHEDPSVFFSGLDVNQQGHVYTANTNAGTIVTFDEDGTQLSELLVADDPQSGGDRPRDVAVDDNGTIYVTSFGGEILSVFNSDGSPTAQWTHIDIESSSAGGLIGVTVAPSGDLYINSDLAVVRVAPDGTVMDNWVVEPAVTTPLLFPPGSVAVNDAGAIVFPDLRNKRILVLDESGSTTLEIKEKRPDRFALPGGMDVGHDGTLWVADATAQRLVRFTANEESLDPFTWVADTGPRIGTTPGDVTRTEDNIYVLDGIAPAVIKLTTDAEKLLEWTSRPFDEDAWGGPNGILSDSSGDIYVIDWQNPRILKYDPDGQFLGDWTAATTGPERQQPTAMDVREDVVYVAFSGGSEPGIWTLDLDGNVLDRVVAFTTDDEGNSETLPVGLAVAPTGDMFTIDPFTRTVRWYAPDGDLRSEWELDTGPDLGRFVDIAVSDTGTVYVSDGATRQILVFEPVS